jgi:hypothetical protein
MVLAQRSTQLTELGGDGQVFGGRKKAGRDGPAVQDAQAERILVRFQPGQGRKAVLL